MYDPDEQEKTFQRDPGEEFYFKRANGKTIKLKCVKTLALQGGRCKLCYFNDKGTECIDTDKLGLCSEESRKDNQNVIFIEQF